MSKQKGKQFFFEKKNQKTFTHWLRSFRRVSAQDSKVFCFFFSKKKVFLRLLQNRSAMFKTEQP